MASTRINRLSNGRITYQILWRDPETRKQTSWTVDTIQERDNFKRVLEANGLSLAPTLALLEAVKKKTPTIADVLEEHITSRTSVTARSRADYRRDAGRHIAPHLGHIPVDTLNRQRVSQWVNALAATDMADKTLANIHGLLSAAMNTAVDMKLRPDNPCKGMKLPRRNDHESEQMHFLTQDEWMVLYGELGRVLDGWHQLMFLTLYLTGMRWGEVVALRVGDLSFDTHPAIINISRASRRDENSRNYIGPTKTKKSRRLVSIPPELAAKLRAHVEGRPRDALMFTSRTGARVLHSNVRSRVWLPATAAAMDREKYGVRALTERPRIHDLRHTHASMQIADGRDLLAVQNRLGHESLKTTADRYGHLMPVQQLAAAESASRAMVW